MAWADYKICDHCGNAKVFYDANIEDERYQETWGEPSDYDPIGLKAICGECNKTHEVVIVPRDRADEQALANEKVQALVEALGPIIEVADNWHNSAPSTIPTVKITVGHCRNVRAAIAALEVK